MRSGNVADIHNLTYLSEFIYIYIKKHYLNNNFTFYFHDYSGNVIRVFNISQLEKHVDYVFKYFKGDNEKMYVKFNKELENNKIIISMVNKESLANLPFTKFAYVHVAFDKVNTPFDNCVDLKLLIYKNLEEIKGVPRWKYMLPCINLVKHINSQGFFYNGIGPSCIMQDVYNKKYVLCRFRDMSRSFAGITPKEHKELWAYMRKDVILSRNILQKIIWSFAGIRL